MLLFIVLNKLIDDLLFVWLPDQFISIAWHYIKRQTIKHLLKEYLPWKSSKLFWCLVWLLFWVLLKILFYLAFCITRSTKVPKQWVKWNSMFRGFHLCKEQKLLLQLVSEEVYCTGPSGLRADNVISTE